MVSPNDTTCYLTIEKKFHQAGAGNIIGGDFADLKGIIDGVEDKSRIGVCLDTCVDHFLTNRRIEYSSNYSRSFVCCGSFFTNCGEKLATFSVSTGL